MTTPDHVYAAVPELRLRRTQRSKSANTTVLMDAWMKVVSEDGDWYQVEAFGKDGWVKKTETRPSATALKVFFVDVGQGDAVLIETPQRRILVDGGQYSAMRRYLMGWKYKWVLNLPGHQRIRIDDVFVSHFDADHFGGLVSIIGNDRFKIGRVWHAGIPRYADTSSKRPPGIDTEVGRTNVGSGARTKVTSSFDDIDSARNLLAVGGLMPTFRNFLQAVVDAHDVGRLDSIGRLTSRSDHVPGYSGNGDGLKIEPLGPVPLSSTGIVQYPWFSDNSHTVNGHSLVLLLTFDQRRLLLGGDLNREAEEYLLNHYAASLPFQVDVAKACHHGSSDFSVDFLSKLEPYATVFSSGDNENYAHPSADALGSAGKYSRGDRPLIWSTEIGRSNKNAGEEIHYGLVNCRTDGKQLAMAQMFEKRKAGDVWDCYQLATDGSDGITRCAQD
ncbi:MAG: MBL fold metallo-hydrolase [bacterium]|nr:MBL fold metallo-hydrolase [bacterium]